MQNQEVKMMITCTFVNKTREKQWKENYPDFQRIAEHALEVLNKQGDYTISVIFVKSRKRRIFLLYDYQNPNVLYIRLFLNYAI